jgi:hypothetical protein
MYNWSTDTSKLKKDPEKFKIWQLEQKINFGLSGEKLEIKELKRYWSKLHLDPKRKQVLSLWLGLK